jgi:hypothetical protein
MWALPLLSEEWFARIDRGSTLTGRLHLWVLGQLSAICCHDATRYLPTKSMALVRVILDETQPIKTDLFDM